jgi:hypothetical protein
MSIESKRIDQNLLAANYCVSFIDLLGQRDALKGQRLLRPFGSEDEQKQFNVMLRESIGAIIKLQDHAEDMLKGILNPNPNSPLRAALPIEQHSIWDDALLTRVKTQHWSDGLMSFVCLGDKEINCQINGVWNLFCLAGAMCLLGLATKHPLRGAIEVAWGVELRPGELYGAAVARAYELESEVAQYPRIVVGSETVKLLEIHRDNPEQDPFSSVNRKKAESCLAMLVQDADGYWILHYLGEEFQYTVSHSQHAALYATARKFVNEQWLKHQADLNTKLAFRYWHLLQYFEAHPPVSLENNA